LAIEEFARFVSYKKMIIRKRNKNDDLILNSGKYISGFQILIVMARELASEVI